MDKWEGPVTRAAIRTLVENEARELQDLANSGGNPFQAALDQQDRLEVLRSGLGEQEQQLFMTLYLEEKNAANMAHQVEIDRQQAESVRNASAQAASSAQSALVLPVVLGLIVFLVVLVFLLKR